MQRKDHMQTKDRIVRERERLLITGVPRASASRLEKTGDFPKRIRLSQRAVGWLETELIAWVHQRREMKK